MSVEALNRGDELAHALSAADALGKASRSAETDGLADAMRDLDMDNYDEEDGGTYQLSTIFNHIN